MAAGENPSRLGASAFNHRFPGQYRDAETGLFYNYFRDYDSQTGRYVQSDPIGLAGGINPYLYAGGNPAKFSDPTGEVVWIGGAAALGAGLGALANIVTTLRDPCWDGSFGTLGLNAMIGAGTGALAGLAFGIGIPGIASGALMGGGLGAINAIGTGLVMGNVDARSVGTQAGLGALTGGLGGAIGRMGTHAALPELGERALPGLATAAMIAGNRQAVAVSNLYLTELNVAVPQNLGGFAGPSGRVNCGCK